jgi:hypothetical protein
MALAMQLNNLLASPGFQNWLKGEPLDTANLLYDANGKPKGSVISIAHLSDAERMFFMTLLLADILAWVRAQPGTGSLRAILYIDELFGYMPPVANPPSKVLLLTLLKQARAFGLGVVLATQNPVDLDYRGLSNTGTWFIGRLQTERDKMRVMEGLEGASGGQPFDKDAMEKTIAGLGKRVFLLHSVHEPAPVTFETRWTMSYLAGPMTREQIKRLQTQTSSASAAPVSASASAASASGGTTAGTAAIASSTSGGVLSLDPSATAHAPVLPPDIAQFYLPPTSDGDTLQYNPQILGIADVSFTNAKLGVNDQRRVVLLADVTDGAIALEWSADNRVELDPAALEREPRDRATFGEIPKPAMTAKSYVAWTKSFQKWVVANEQVQLLSSATLGLTSNPDESERDFRIRLQTKAREDRDANVERLRLQYASKMTALQEQRRRAQQTVEREKAEATQAKVSTMISVGSAILGAVFGRGKVTATEIGKVGSAVRGAGRAVQQSGDVGRANESVAAIDARYADLEAQLQSEIDGLGALLDAQQETLTSIPIKAKSGDVHIQLVALAWVPYTRDAAGMSQAAWR